MPLDNWFSMITLFFAGLVAGKVIFDPVYKKPKDITTYSWNCGRCTFRMSSATEATIIAGIEKHENGSHNG